MAKAELIKCEICGQLVEDMMDHIDKHHSSHIVELSPEQVKEIYPDLELNGWICDKCGRHVESGLMNAVRHDEEYHPRFTEPITEEDLKQWMKDMMKLSQVKQQMTVGKGFFEWMTDDQFVGFLEGWGEDYELMMGKECWQYIHERYEKVTGKKL